ncbi:nitrite reductase small subunit NirD [Henriciella aquimarina]|uniref:nitrite reductase small subunit NirD n=1 Tax=Henriciella aquimarina TaxID=545261 RepID=UPI0009FDA39B|nr:nitrite reductase small subunit NirD [Henriciella aquimarina]
MSGPETFWVEVCSLDDIPARGSRILKTEAGCIAVFRTASDEVYALDDRCPHMDGPLSQGIVHGHTVTCPLHSLVLDLKTGAACGPDEGQAITYPAKVLDGRVNLDLKKLRR